MQTFRWQRDVNRALRNSPLIVSSSLWHLSLLSCPLISIFSLYTPISLLIKKKKKITKHLIVSSLIENDNRVKYFISYYCKLKNFFFCVYFWSKITRIERQPRRYIYIYLQNWLEKELKKFLSHLLLLLLISHLRTFNSFSSWTLCSQIPRQVARSINKPARNCRRVLDRRPPPRYSRPRCSRHRLCRRHRRPVRKHGRARQARWPKRLRARRERRRCRGWPWSWERTRRYRRCTWRRG